MPPMSLNEQALDIVSRLPRGGGYDWPSDDPRAGGCLADIVHDGGTVLRAGRPRAPGKLPPSYCCGLTLEVWFRAWASINRKPPLTFAQARTLQRRWFVTDPAHKRGCLEALVAVGLGVDTSDDPEPGNFAQIWRRNGTGHSVIVLSYDKETNTLRYLSTQASTNGIGERTERPRDLYSVRAIVPDVNGA